MRLYYTSAKCLHCLQLAAFKPSVLVCRERGENGHAIKKSHCVCIHGSWNVVFHVFIESWKRNVVKKGKNTIPGNSNKYSSTKLYLFYTKIWTTYLQFEQDSTVCMCSYKKN